MEAEQENRKTEASFQSVVVIDTEGVTNQVLAPMMKIWHLAAEVFQSPS